MEMAAIKSTLCGEIDSQECIWERRELDGYFLTGWCNAWLVVCSVRAGTGGQCRRWLPDHKRGKIETKTTVIPSSSPAA